MYIMPIPFLSKYLEKPFSSLEKCLILVCSSQEISPVITSATENQMGWICWGGLQGRSKRPACCNLAGPRVGTRPGYLPSVITALGS